MKTICIKWSTDDVFCVADEMGIKIMESQSDQVLEQMERRHDASVGINWGTIENYLQELID
jgi:hypothetical protein